MEKKDEKKRTMLVLKKQSLQNLTDLQLDVIAGGRQTASEPHGPPVTD
jgi:hypothetical protein